MRNLKSALAVSALVLTGCNSVQGTVDIARSFTYQNKASDSMIEFCRRNPSDFYCKGIDTSNKSVTFLPGRYSGKLSFQSKSDALLEIKGASGRNETSTLKFSLPKGQTFPRYEGDVSISSAQLGQAYDLKGTVHTVEGDSETTRTTESCIYYVKERVCTRVDFDPRDRRDGHGPGRGRGPGHGGRPVCEWKDVARTGTQEVEYHYHTADTTFDVSLLTPNTSQQLARFYGHSVDTDKVYDYKGQCY